MNNLPFHTRPLTDQEILATCVLVRDEMFCGRMVRSTEAIPIAKTMVALKDGNICPQGYGFSGITRNCIPWVIECSKN